MTPTPHTPPPGTDDNLLPSKRVRALLVFLGVWLIGTGITLVFAQHKYNPFDAFTSTVTLAGVPFVVGAYAAILAAVWAAVPRSRFELVNELVRTGVTIVGGMFAPHTLTSLFGLFR